MLKNIAICVLFLLVIALALFAVFNRSQINDRDRRVVLAEEERKQAIEAQDRAERALKLTRDTLELAYLNATNAKRDAQIAINQAQKQLKEHEAIVFKHFDSDTARINAWSRLYPTAKFNR